MDGIHDLGGRQGFGPVAVSRTDTPLENHWEAAVFTIINQLLRQGVAPNVDYFRHAIERIDPLCYLADGYYGRWLGAAEAMLVEAGVLTQDQISAAMSQLGGARSARIAARPDANLRAELRTSPTDAAVESEARQPAFTPGTHARTQAFGRSGHTRLPAYARGKVGQITACHGLWVYPDSNAVNNLKEQQYLYTVVFNAQDLWGESAHPADSVSLDLFEPYLVELDDGC